ncbi:MAG TPA: hypothetical protein PKD17_04580 [Cellvibrionaceae bacterium]|nr:hypothetical protein [Cellvibrionaceae bacterium]HMW71069.1 hypothetical protein [Cellvibrionaceae bacterium]HMY37866.1 hypothetical protein [Marinagarivorans sp.]HNG58941.1 hypothetical protein [Cellvibrionaceae bacterium]
MKTENDFYISDIKAIERDLYRNGNANVPKFTDKDGNIRPQDAKLKTDSATGIAYVFPSHAGVSAHEIFDGGKNRWKIKAKTAIPKGLALAFDLVTPGHVHIVATRPMTQTEYIGLLELMFKDAERITNILAELALNKSKLHEKRA